MPKPRITGLPGNISVDGIDFSSLTVKKHGEIIRCLASPNYIPVDGWLVRRHGKKPWTIIAEHGEYGEQELIDCQSMYSAVNLGHHNKRIKKPYLDFLHDTYAAVSRGINHDMHAPALYALRSLIGWGDVRILFKNGGGEAVETAIKVARKNWWLAYGKPPERHDQGWPYIVVADQCFHGRPIGATAFLEEKSREGFGPLRGAIKIPFNHLAALDNVLAQEHKKVAGVLLEPIQGEGGVNIPDENYLPGVQSLCRKYGVLFMLDEVQTGFGRTGKNFAFEHYGIEPDVLILGKSLGGGIEAASAVVGRCDAQIHGGVYDVLACLTPGTEGATRSADAKVCVAILTAIKELCDKNYAEQSARKGVVLLTELQNLKRKYPDVITDVRGKGLMAAIDVKLPARVLSETLLKNGVWMFPTQENTLRILPPLCVPQRVLKNVVTILDASIKELLEAL